MEFKPILNYHLVANMGDSGFKFSIDSILIARFPRYSIKIKNILEIGTNNGVVSLIASEFTNAKIDAIEIDEDASRLAIENIKKNKKENQIKIINDDFKTHKFIKKYDLIISNPPYYDSNIGKQTKNFKKNKAIFDFNLKLHELVKNSKKISKTKTKLIFIYESKRLDEVLIELKKNKFSPKILQFIYFKKEKESQIFLIESIFEGKNGLHIMPPLVITNEKGEYTKQVKKLWQK